MEKHSDPFDDFIRETMKGHGLTPRDKARKAFLDEASGLLPARKWWRTWYILPVVVVFLSGVVAFFVFYNNPEQGSKQESAISSQQSEVRSQQSAVGGQQPLITNDQEPITNNQEPITNDQEPITNNQEPITNNQEPITNDQEPITNDQEPITNDQEPITNDREPMTNNQEPITNDQEPIANDPQSISWHFATGAYYLPELMFNTVEGNKFVHNTGVEAIFYHGLVSIRTGLGVSVSKGTTMNEIAYNDYLGSYNKLDSVTFDYNEQIHNYEPEIYTSSQKVWDSVAQADSSEIIKRYTYLQVPLALGFDFWQKGRFSVGVRVGTIMSVLLKYKQLTGEYDPGENLVVGVSQLTPSQVSLNWQATGGFAASAALTEKLYLEIEPQAKYYYGSIYEKSGNVKKPWSLGIRMAVLYKF
jgi:hypothetical protein